MFRKYLLHVDPYDAIEIMLCWCFSKIEDGLEHHVSQFDVASYQKPLLTYTL